MAVEDNKNPLKGISGRDLADFLDNLVAEGKFLQDPLIIYKNISEKTDRKSVVIDQFISYQKQT